MDRLIATLRAAGEPTRLRLLALLGRGELTVSEMVQILGQSQPRVSRHIKLLSEAGLVHRIPEGSWVFYRLSDADTDSRRLADAVIGNLPEDDSVIRRDLERLEMVRAQRAEIAERYFQNVSDDWDHIRSLHLSEQAVEAAMRELIGERRFPAMLDIGTGTGRVLELFSDIIDRGVGVDVNRDMLSVARANLGRVEGGKLSIQHADLYALPFEDGFADLVTIHQVMHYLHDPAMALGEAARVLAPGGLLLIVDFAPHQLEFLRTEHQHRRLGFSDGEIESWAAAAGLVTARRKSLLPTGPDERLTVKLWAFESERQTIREIAQ